MNKYTLIKEFASKRPEAKAIFGYGSGVFHQASYTNNDKPQIDVIFVVDDLEDWHLTNISLNKNDYTIMGSIPIKLRAFNYLKGYNKITYYSDVKDLDCTFKYGVTEANDFLNNLKTWDNFFLAGRFQKPVLEVKSDPKIDRAILENRKKALMVASLLSSETTTRTELFKKICYLSYMGTPRMKYAENPHKIENIVSGSKDYLYQIYTMSTPFLDIDGELVKIDYNELMNRIFELPPALLDYILSNDYDNLDIELVAEKIENFLVEHNKKEELHQSIDGIKTNGIVRSVPYFTKKLQKKYKGR